MLADLVMPTGEVLIRDLYAVAVESGLNMVCGIESIGLFGGAGGFGIGGGFGVIVTSSPVRRDCNQG